MNYDKNEAVVGQFIRQARPQSNVNTFINGLFELFRPRPAVYHGAVVSQGKDFPDISFYQGSPNFDIMRGKTDALIIRAGQRAGVDPELRRNMNEAKRVGMKRGNYWFYDDRASPGNQAALLITELKKDPPEMEVFIDYEYNYGGNYAGLKNVVAMMELVEAAGFKVGLYTGYYYFIANSNPVTNASQYNYLKNKPLWLAWYTTNPEVVKVPAPWTRALLWQYGTPAIAEQYGVDPNVAKEIDMDSMSLDEFNQRYNGEQPTDPPPPTGDPSMAKWKATAKVSNLCVFPEPKCGPVAVEVLQPGDVRFGNFENVSVIDGIKWLILESGEYLPLFVVDGEVFTLVEKNELQPAPEIWEAVTLYGNVNVFDAPNGNAVSSIPADTTVYLRFWWETIPAAPDAGMDIWGQLLTENPGEWVFVRVQGGQAAIKPIQIVPEVPTEPQPPVDNWPAYYDLTDDNGETTRYFKLI